MLKTYEEILSTCQEVCREGRPRTALEVAERLMDLPGIGMHCQEHHFIVPAALLTSVRCAQGEANLERLTRELELAADRAGKVAGGFCGFQGCCGAAVGCGIFASVLLESNPKKEEHWDKVNLFTAKCLERIALAGGPRCCKRVTYLALSEAVERGGELLGVALSPLPGEIRCTRFAQNKECRGVRCPYFPTKQ